MAKTFGMAVVAGKMRQDAHQERDVRPSEHESAIALVAFLEQQVEGHITRETGSRSQVDCTDGGIACGCERHAGHNCK